jgi:hypothetical protein
MVEIDLENNECAILRHVLESYLSDLRMEIAHTDSFDFRDMLKERKAVIRKVLGELGEDHP